MINGAHLRGVITDWGGVLTTPILTTVQAWIQADSIDWDSYRAVMRSWVFDAYGPDASQNPVHALERGECSGAEFEQMLAARLLRTDGGVVTAEGILQRMFAASTSEPAMYDMIRTVRRAGFRTAWVFDAYGPDASQNPVHALERGECSGAEFEQMLAARLLRTDGGVVTAEGILQRMFAASTSVPAMYDMIRTVRGVGFRTGLLSNSWDATNTRGRTFPACLTPW